jgi:murein endopeptidase
MNGACVHRVFLHNTAMHRYDAQDNIVETIFVGPLLTTLCKDADVYVGYLTKNTPLWC